MRLFDCLTLQVHVNTFKNKGAPSTNIRTVTVAQLSHQLLQFDAAHSFLWLKFPPFFAPLEGPFSILPWEAEEMEKEAGGHADNAASMGFCTTSKET